jgi:hypothetical protein
MYFPSSDPAFHVPQSTIDVVPNCCNDFKYIFNETITWFYREEVNNFITIAGDVNNDQIWDSVIVKPSGTLSVTAGNEIRIRPGFLAERHGGFSAKIQPCASAYRKGALRTRLTNSVTEAPAITLQKDSLHRFNVFPNPGNGLYTIKLPKQFKGILAIYDPLGHHIKTVPFDQEQFTVDLRNYSPGLYLFNLIGSEFNQQFRIMQVLSD